jgi:hypothetical protein
VVIRLVEGDGTTRAPLVARLAPALGVPGSLVTSRLTRLECRSKPLKAGDVATLAQFDVFFAGVELVVVELSAAVVERARDLRTRYNLKTPDFSWAAAPQSGVVRSMATNELGRTMSRPERITDFLGEWPRKRTKFIPVSSTRERRPQCPALIYANSLSEVS